ncbi:hypothetical protein [uncultured Rikenella sp.]|uniref:hypothetical protein n=1 Tax=uncultured Rikenella sp. TaxID=368003 RepID=UPI00272D10D7|nr:hypothetical protein [uncultured Rikenella sp.]
MERRARPPNGIFHLRRTEGRETPAPGYRDYGRTGYEGVAGNVGGEGTVWSASVPSGTQGMNSNFHVSWLYPSNANYRGYGFLLRCLSE